MKQCGNKHLAAVLSKTVSQSSSAASQHTSRVSVTDCLFLPVYPEEMQQMTNFHISIRDIL